MSHTYIHVLNISIRFSLVSSEVKTVINLNTYNRRRRSCPGQVRQSLPRRQNTNHVV